jgi:hypothetical protein
MHMEGSPDLGATWVAVACDASGNLTTGGGGGGASTVTGNVASGVADAGNPVKVGGLASTTAPTAVANNQRVNAWYGVNGTAVVSITNAAGTTTDAATARKLQDPAGNLVLAGMASHVHNGATWDQKRGPTVFIDVPSTAVVAGTGIVVWTPAAGKKFRLMGWALTLSVAGSIIFCDHVVATILFRTPALLAGTPLAGPPLGNGRLSAAANNVLRLDVTASGNVSGVVFGVEE